MISNSIEKAELITNGNTNTNSKIKPFNANIEHYEHLILNTLILINNLINEQKKLHERIRIRGEFDGLKLNELFKDIR